MAEHIKCDILFAGAGLAGLSLLYRGIKAGLWKHQQIVVVDQSAKTDNDKTWSFWEKRESPFAHLIKHRWTDLFFYKNDGQEIRLDTKDYTYNSIKSIDFYNHVRQFLSQFDQIRFVEAEIVGMESADQAATLHTTRGTYSATYLFNSIYNRPDVQQGMHYFLQHFKGLRIRTRENIPTKPAAWLMDFRTGQENGTTFFYTLPMASNEVFVEYTLFSKILLEKEAYDEKIRLYIREVLKVQHYEVLEEEYGVIPMTDHQFSRCNGHIIHIGTAGGDTRGSTGYTFTNIQKTVGKIIDSFQQHQHPFFAQENIGLKHQLYDATLLDVLDQEQYKGHQLFGDLFSNTPAWRIFDFLDAESNVVRDIHIMKSLKVMPFLKSFVKAIVLRFRFSKK